MIEGVRDLEGSRNTFEHKSEPESLADLQVQRQHILEQKNAYKKSIERDTEHLKMLCEKLGLTKPEDTFSIKANKEKLNALRGQFSKLQDRIIDMGGEAVDDPGRPVQFIDGKQVLTKDDPTYAGAGRASQADFDSRFRQNPSTFKETYNRDEAQDRIKKISDDYYASFDTKSDQEKSPDSNFTQKDFDNIMDPDGANKKAHEDFWQVVDTPEFKKFASRYSNEELENLKLTNSSENREKRADIVKKFKERNLG